MIGRFEFFAKVLILLFDFRYRSNRVGKRLEMRLNFETACPDSQQFIVYRLYPRLLSLPSFSDMVDFSATPWGLASREQSKFFFVEIIYY